MRRYSGAFYLGSSHVVRRTETKKSCTSIAVVWVIFNIIERFWGVAERPGVWSTFDVRYFKIRHFTTEGTRRCTFRINKSTLFRLRISSSNYTKLSMISRTRYRLADCREPLALLRVVLRYAQDDYVYYICRHIRGTRCSTEVCVCLERT